MLEKDNFVTYTVIMMKKSNETFNETFSQGNIYCTVILN